jgi:hypothetical protein
MFTIMKSEHRQNVLKIPVSHHKKKVIVPFIMKSLVALDIFYLLKILCNDTFLNNGT